MDRACKETVYFIGELTEDVRHGPIKIGVSDRPEARLAGHQVSNPRELILLASFAAPAGTEKRLHSRLAEHHLRGEWFLPHSDVLEAIDEHVALYGGTGCARCEWEQPYRDRGQEPPERGPMRHVCGAQGRAA